MRDAVNQIDTVKETERQRKVYLGRERERDIESRAIDRSTQLLQRDRKIK